MANQSHTGKRTQGIDEGTVGGTTLSKPDGVLCAADFAERKR